METRTLPVLRRSRSSRVFAGVCGGVGDYFGVDPVLVRVALILLVVAGFGLGIVLYAIAWLIIPEAQSGDVTRRDPSDSQTGPRFLIGVALIGLGAVLLISNVIPWLFDRGVLAALALVVVGGVLIAQATRR